MGRNEKTIRIDAAVVSHFITGGAILKWPSIFPYKIKILDKVYAELSRFLKGKQKLIT
jgi:hypothetical protein